MGGVVRGDDGPEAGVRGYGPIDSPRVQSRPGKTLALRAVIAGSEKDAAQYYPGMYWYSLLGIPE